ncbi:hypothetical protein QBC34DRAFT_471588, partial [Podospora aff. communis PSN243]
MSLSTLQVGRRDHLSRLPVELLFEISSEIGKHMKQNSSYPNYDHACALAALCLTNRRLNSVFTQVLYKVGGNSAMIWGAYNGSIDVMEKALSFGTDINQNGKHRSIEYEISDKQSDLEREDDKLGNPCGAPFRLNYGAPPFVFAIISCQRTAIDWLLDRGADVPINVTEYLAHHPNSPWELSGERFSIVSMLCERGIICDLDLEMPDTNMTAVEWAVDHKDFPLACTFLDLGASPSQWALYRMLKFLTKDQGWEPQAKAGEDLFRRLAGKDGQNLNVIHTGREWQLGGTDCTPMTAFLCRDRHDPRWVECCEHDDVIVSLMCELGADVNIKGRGRMTAMHCAISNWCHSVRESIDPETEYVWAMGGLAVVWPLLKAGANLATSDCAGNTPLDYIWISVMKWAMAWNHEDVLKEAKTLMCRLVEEAQPGCIDDEMKKDVDKRLDICNNWASSYIPDFEVESEDASDDDAEASEEEEENSEVEEENSEVEEENSEAEEDGA